MAKNTPRFSMSEFRQKIAALNKKHCTTAAQMQAVLNEMTALTEQAARDGLSKILIEEFQQLQHGMPFDTGRASAGWMLSDRATEESPPVIQRVGPKPEGGKPEDHILPEYRAAIQEAADYAATSGLLATTDVVYVINNVEYILGLNAGWSKQQPAGFIDAFLLRVKARIEELAQEFSAVQ